MWLNILNAPPSEDDISRTSRSWRRSRSPATAIEDHPWAVTVLCMQSHSHHPIRDCVHQTQVIGSRLSQRRHLHDYHQHHPLRTILHIGNLQIVKTGISQTFAAVTDPPSTSTKMMRMINGLITTMVARIQAVCMRFLAI